MIKNIFYFKKINRIGGTEQFLYEIAKKYKDFDITVFYDEADIYQINRLRKYVRCKKRIPGEKIECENAFYNFNIDIIDDVEAKEHIFISHAIYQELGFAPPIKHPKLTRFVGVSQYSSDMLEEYAKLLGLNIKAEKCYNPLTLEPKEKIIKLVSACRLEDHVKGGRRTKELIRKLDEYCERTGSHYIWLIFSNSRTKKKVKIDSPNVALMKPRTDVRPYIANADYVLQLSNDMETYCYTINEALGYGVPVITTPLTVTKELYLTEDMQIVLNWDCSNIDEVVEKIFNKPKKEFKYNIPLDNWSNLLAKGKSNYEEEKKMKYLVEATDKYVKRNKWDAELSQKKSEEEGKEVKYFPKEGEQWVVSYERKELLVEKGFAKIIKEIEEVTEKIKEDEVEIEVKINEEDIIPDEEAEKLKEDEVIEVETKEVTVEKSKKKDTKGNKTKINKKKE